MRIILLALAIVTPNIIAAQEPDAQWLNSVSCIEFTSGNYVSLSSIVNLQQLQEHTRRMGILEGYIRGYVKARLIALAEFEQSEETIRAALSRNVRGATFAVCEQRPDLTFVEAVDVAATVDLN